MPLFLRICLTSVTGVCLSKFVYKCAYECGRTFVEPLQLCIYVCYVCECARGYACVFQCTWSLVQLHVCVYMKASAAKSCCCFAHELCVYAYVYVLMCMCVWQAITWAYATTVWFCAPCGLWYLRRGFSACNISFSMYVHTHIYVSILLARFSSLVSFLPTPYSLPTLYVYKQT